MSGCFAACWAGCRAASMKRRPRPCRRRLAWPSRACRVAFHSDERDRAPAVARAAARRSRMARAAARRETLRVGPDGDRPGRHHDRREAHPGDGADGDGEQTRLCRLPARTRRAGLPRPAGVAGGSRWGEGPAGGRAGGFGTDVPIQRCQWHKRENVVSYLTTPRQVLWRRKLQAAYAHPSYADAKRAL